MWRPQEVRTATPVISQKRSDRRRNNTTATSATASCSANGNTKTSPTISIPPILSPSTSTLYEPSIHLSNLLNVNCNKSTLSTSLNQQQQQLQQQYLQQQQQLQQQQMVQQSSLSSSSSSSMPLLSVKVTVPKVPKPQRTQIIFEHVLTGLNLSINELKAKVSDLTAAVTNGYTAMSKQLLQSQAHLRHMEQRANNLEKLRASYEVHLKMREGIENMFEAYKKSPGKNQGRNLASIKAGWKECVQTLCLIEAQTEALLGTFRFQVEKLIGFARLCPGDVYEIQIKYGQSSKFRARTKIAKDGSSQTWDATNFALKITVHDLLLFRINEIKFLGKNILIGERIFDTKDLFSTTQTQRLTINANTSGTLKLSMLITWLPFENSEDTFIYYNPTQYLTLSNTTTSNKDKSRLQQQQQNTNASMMNYRSYHHQTTTTGSLNVATPPSTSQQSPSTSIDQQKGENQQQVQHSPSLDSSSSTSSSSSSSSSSTSSSCSPPEDRRMVVESSSKETPKTDNSQIEHTTNTGTSSSSASSSSAVAADNRNNRSERKTSSCQHSLLLTSSPSTSSLCSSSKQCDELLGVGVAAAVAVGLDSRRMSSRSGRSSHRSCTSYNMSSDSLNVAHEVESLLADMCDRVAVTNDRLKCLYERLSARSSLFPHPSSSLSTAVNGRTAVGCASFEQHLRMIRSVLRRRLGVVVAASGQQSRRHSSDELETEEKLAAAAASGKKKKKKMTKRTVGCENEEDEEEEEEEDSLSVMLDDVLQYFDFLNAESSSDDLVGTPTSCTSSSSSGGGGHLMNDDQDDDQDEILIEHTYDLTRLMDLHLTRLWIIVDELNFINSQNESYSSKTTTTTMSKLNQFETNLITRLSREIECFAQLDSHLDALFNASAGINSAASDVVEATFFARTLGTTTTNTNTTTATSTTTILSSATKLDVWRKSLAANSLFTADLKNLTREFAAHMHPHQKARAAALVYFFEKLAANFVANVVDYNDDHDDHDDFVERSTQYLSIFHYNLVFDCLKQIDLSDLQMDENKSMAELLFDRLKQQRDESSRGGEGECGKLLDTLSSGLVLEVVLKDLIELVLDSNDHELRNRLKAECENKLEEKLLKILNDLVLENLISLKVDESDNPNVMTTNPTTTTTNTNNNTSATSTRSDGEIKHNCVKQDRIQLLIDYMTSFSPSALSSTLACQLTTK